MSVQIKRILYLAALIAVFFLFLAACSNPGLEVTSAFQTQVALRVEDTLAAAPTASPIPTTTEPSPVPITILAPTETVQPSATTPPTLTASPTAREALDPTLNYYYLTPENTPVTAVPSPVPHIKQEDEVKNILLIGSDKADSNGGYRSDTLIVVSINKTTGAVTLLSIPRDLYVFIPQSKNVMGRINTVINTAIKAKGGPIPLLEQTILYNLGIPIHYYARVDFDSFRTIVDTLGGIDIPVTCDFQDYRLKDPSFDPTLEDNWELFTLPAGIQHLDGDTALWYARSRQTYSSGDFDRHRRQQEVLRAMFRRARDQNLFLQIPALYQQFQATVETDMALGDVLQFVQLGLALDELNIRSYNLLSVTRGWRSPKDESIIIPGRAEETSAEFYQYIQRVMTERDSNRIAQTPYSIEVWNGTTWDQADDLAAYRLSLEGLRVSIGSADRTDYPTTQLFDYTTSPKGSPIRELQKLLHLANENIIAQPDPNSPVQFRLILGADYKSCSYNVAPVVTLTPTPAPPTATPVP